MVKQGIKNYFGCLKYIFTSLGAMFLGMMIGLSIFVPAIMSAASDLADGVKNIAAGVNLDFGAIWGHVWTAIRSLDWNNPDVALKTVFSAKWMNDILTFSLQSLLGTDFETFKTLIEGVVAAFISDVIRYAIVFVVWWILGFIVGYMLTKFFIRRDIARRSLWKFLLTGIVNSVLSVAFVALLTVVFFAWKPSVVIAVIVAMPIVGMFALLQAYLVYGRGKVKLKQIVNLKNVGLFMLTVLIIFAISVCIILIATAINLVLGVFIGLSVIVIALTVVSMNAESYVISCAAAPPLPELLGDSTLDDPQPIESDGEKAA